MGLGDIGVSHRIKGMIKAFYGRVTVYDEGVAEDGDTRLIEALKRNLYRKSEPTDDQVSRMARYVYEEIDNLSAQENTEILKGQVRFGPAPRTSEAT